jgi:hypothetical protein
LYSDDQWFNVPMKGYRREKSLNFVHEGFGGATIAEFRIAPTGPDADTAMDKLMIEMYGVYARSDVMPTFDETRYYAFSLRLPPEFGAPGPGERFIIWQLWQGSPYSPPVRLEIGPGDVLRLGLRNDETGGKSEPVLGPETDLREIDRDPRQSGVQALERDVWHRIVVGVLPRHAKMAAHGVVKVWLDDLDPKRPLVTIDDTFIGYNPDGWAGTSSSQREADDERPLPRFDTSFGVYRTRQLRTQALFFADVAVTSDFASAK